MTYCGTCRRHLNGALSCPGCGTPSHSLAPVDITEPEPTGPAAPEPYGQGGGPYGPHDPYGGGDAYGGHAGHGGEHGFHHDGRGAGDDDGAYGGPYGDEAYDDGDGTRDEDDGDGSDDGRPAAPASRRGRRARKHTGRRRRAIVVGLMLGAGLTTLGVAEITTEGVLKELPLPGAPSDDDVDEPDGGGGVDGGVAEQRPGTGRPGEGSPSASGSPSGSASASPEPSGSASGSASPDASSSPSPSTTAVESGVVTVPPEPTTEPTGDPEPTQPTQPEDPPPPSEEPDPEPTRTCDRFLWWCT